MQRASLVWLSWLVAGLSVGCGGDDTPNPLATRAGFCGEWAKVACNKEVIEACAATGEDACREAQQEHCLSVVSADAYRSSGARACLDAVKTALRDGRLTSEEVGVVLRGEGACKFECVKVDDGGCIEPTVVGGGEECSDADVVCAEGYFCDGNNCLARRDVGRACSDDIPCREDLRCVGDAGEKVCEARTPDGEACEEDDDCQSGICGRGTNLCAARITLSDAEPVCNLFR